MMLKQIFDRLPEDSLWQSKIHWYDSIESTNTEAKRMALSGAPHGTVLIADHQTGGRGRMGHTFQSPAGMGLYMSVLLRPQCSAEKLMHLTCATAVAVCDGIENTARFRPGIKWTNDLVWKRKKLGGILTELVFTPDGVCAVIGIGINCCQAPGDFAPELQSIACSLAMVTGSQPNRAAIAAGILTALEAMSAGLLTNKEAILNAYRRDCITLGQQISLLRADEVRHGKAIDLDSDGALVVLFPDGHTEAVNSGEVSVRGMYGYV